MTNYWDTSALIDLLHNPGLRATITPQSDATRLHSLSELFSTLTKGVSFRYSPDDAAKMINSVAEDLTLIDLTKIEVTAAISEAKKLGVRGARIHDLMHARAAEKSAAKNLFTLDTAGFKGIAPSLIVKSP